MCEVQLNLQIIRGRPVLIQPLQMSVKLNRSGETRRHTLGKSSANPSTVESSYYTHTFKTKNIELH